MFEELAVNLGLVFDSTFVDNETFLGVVIFWFGAVWGSFGNVLIVRLPVGENIALPRSHCRGCKKQIKWFDNIPIVSWFVLFGKCRLCKSKISWKYPLVELLVGIAFVSLYLRYGFTITLFELMVFVFGLITVSFIDFDHMILPNSMTLGGIVVGLLGAMLNPERLLVDALIGILIGGGILWFIAYMYYLFRKVDGMGGGDIKLLAWIGAVLGWKAIPFVILTSSITGSIIGITVAVISRKGMKTAIPFGPYLALGAIFYIFYGQGPVDWYLNLLFPWMN